MSNTNDKIETFKEYTYRGDEFTIYTTTARSDQPIHGVSHRVHRDILVQLPSDTASLVEKIKPNGIPEQFEDPPEKDGYTWEARGWGWNGENVHYVCVESGRGVWEALCLYTDTGESGVSFYIEYLPIPKPVFDPESAETLAKLPKKEGYEPVYRGMGWGKDEEAFTVTCHVDGRYIDDFVQAPYISRRRPDMHYWEYLPITEEMTLAQVCEELGRDVKIIK